MFYDSLILVSLLLASALLLMPTWLRWLFPLWTVAWGVYLFYWHAFVNHPPAVFTLFLMVFVTTLIVWSLKYRQRTILVCYLGCVCAAYGLSMMNYRSIYAGHQRMLAKFPATDLKPRLAYERGSVDHASSRSEKSGQNQDHAAVEHPQFDARSLAAQEIAFREFPYRLGYTGGGGDYRGTRRQRAFEALAQVHAGFVGDFVAQPAMGWGRLPAMRPLSEYDFEVYDRKVDEDDPPALQSQPPPKIEPDGSPKPEPSDLAKNPPANLDAIATTTVGNAPDSAVLQNHHRENVISFAPPNSLGGVNANLEARGFQSHAYRTPVEPYCEQKVPTVESQGWKLARLELVSLLKHRPAAVYVSEHLPAMDELRDAPTRPASAFELDAVEKLRKGQELITEPSPHGLRMVGAIRAIEQCRKCHQVPFGGLLGAFSYRFDRPPPPTKRPVVVPPLAPL